MGAESFVVYYGIRLSVTTEEDFDLLQRKNRHPLVRAANSVGLEHYWGNFSPMGGDEYLLFIGTEIGVFGAENMCRAVVADADLVTLMETTKRKLREAGIIERPSLHMVWEPDY